jgi:RNA polymerase sigma factor (TIGR02999 family)
VPTTLPIALRDASSDLEAHDINRLFSTMYRDLHRLAHGQKRRMPLLETLNTTSLVHEAYLKLADQSAGQWQDPAHFRAVAATAMRHILINYAEHKAAHKRGGHWRRTTLKETPASSDRRTEMLLELGHAMAELDRLDPRLARIVDCRFFAGMTETEIAQALGVTERTIRRDWAKAKTVVTELLSALQSTPQDRRSGVRPHER